MKRAALYALSLVAAVLLAWPLLLLPGCSLSREQRARTALDALAIAGEGSSRTAELVCEQRGDAVVVRAEDPAVPAEELRAELAAVHARCDRTRAGFDALRALHDQAATALEAGSLEEAEALLEQLRTRWRALGGSS